MGPGAELDASTLAALCVMGLPGKLGETPYLGVRCVLHERSASVDAVGLGCRSPEQAVIALRQALDRALERSIGSARRIAVLAGGGLDSAGLLALATTWARRTGGTAFGVALDFAGDGDDRPHLAALQDQLGCEVVRVRPEDAAGRVSLLGGVDAAPCTGPTAPMEIEMMSRARANGAEIVLMGVGGDELFDGNPRSLAALARSGRVGRAIHQARSLQGFDRPRSPVATWVARPLVARCVPRALRMARARRTRALTPAWAGPRLAAYCASAHERGLEAAATLMARGADPTTKSADVAYRHYLAWGRHIEETASGIPRIDPYLDRTLIDEVDSLPADWLLHGGMRRGLFREAMRGLLPESLRMRQDKASFEPALVRFVTAAGGLESLRELARASRISKLELVDRRAFFAAFAAFTSAPGDGDAWTTVWPTLCVEAFLRERRPA